MHRVESFSVPHTALPVNGLRVYKNLLGGDTAGTTDSNRYYPKKYFIPCNVVPSNKERERGGEGKGKCLELCCLSSDADVRCDEALPVQMAKNLLSNAK